jgi:DNA modification methylase
MNIDVEKANIVDESVHLIITSPPYNVGIKYDKHGDNMPYEDYLEWLTRVFTKLKKKLVTGGRICINIAPTGIKNFAPIHHDLILNLRKSGYNLVGEIIWYKQNIKCRTAWGSFKSPRCPYVLPSWEYIYILQKGKFLKETNQKSDITSEEFVKFTDGFWDIKPVTVKSGHPVPFPDELVYRLIKLYSYPGNVVLDPFGGSGTVSKVCNKTHRQFIYVDISEKYFKMALENNKVEMVCPICDGKTKKNGTRTRTLKTTSYVEQRYKCVVCGKRFSKRKANTNQTSSEPKPKHIYPLPSNI